MTDVSKTVAPTEEWRLIPCFGEYAISSLGRVRRVSPDSRNHACRILKPWLNNKGYEIVGLVRDGQSFRRLVSRLVCEAFNGKAPSPQHDAAHGDGAPRNNLPSNLRWATRAENMADCVRHGTRHTGKHHWSVTKPERITRGEQHGHAKITEDAVIAIRSAPKFTGSGRALAKQYGISFASISLIRSGKTWKHIASQHDKECIHD